MDGPDGRAQAPTADALTHDDLIGAGLTETARARRLLIGLAGQGVTDDDVAEILPNLLAALRESPDPDRALLNFVRWTEAIGNRYTHFRYLAGHPTALTIFLNVCGVSQFFSDILARNPEYFELLANPGVRSGARPADVVFGELSDLVDCIAQTELKLEAMRRWRHREMLRIGVRDILGIADMPTTVREFSSLADACIQKCFSMARDRAVAKHNAPAPRFAVIALGKLGGCELNYSSDIDLVFVCDAGGEAGSADGLGDSSEAVSAAKTIAETVVAYLGRDMRNGHLFRVDLRLRPEGRFGAIVRTLDSYRSYYESWAEQWERQAMIKARLVAGDARLGQGFLQMVAQHAYPRRLARADVAAMRENKRRVERGSRTPASADGNTWCGCDVKLGIGGIRDIEFTVQFLQMEHGAHEPLVRTPNTLQAIARLRQARALCAADARVLTDAYVFLRTVEHRLQLLYDHQTQRLPATTREMALLSRRLGMTDADDLASAFERHTMGVRDVALRLFWRDEAPTADRLAADAPDAAQPEPTSPERAWADDLAGLEDADGGPRLAARIGAEGFVEPERALALVRSALIGTDYGREAPDASAGFLRLAPSLIEACARVGDPDAALHGVDLLGQASPNRAEWYDWLADNDDVLRRMVRLASGSRTLVQSLAKHPEWLDLLVSEEMLDPDAKPQDATSDELRRRLRGRGASPQLEGTAFWDALALYVHRERLRIGARDIWGEASPATIAVELSNLADAVIEAMLRRCCSTVAARGGLDPEAVASRIAVIGVGKLGGREPAYNSDLDVLFLCDDDAFEPDAVPGIASPDYGLLSDVAETLLASAHELRARGLPFVLDPRLRPGGRFGPVVRSIEQCRAYYAESADTWERQVLLKARPVAGSPGLASKFMGLAHAACYGRPLSDAEADAIRSMKRRIETERLRPDERHTDLKLGHGGLSDIEFTTQLMQMQHGALCPAVRVPGTLAALQALAERDLIHPPDATRLSACYALLSGVRNRLALLTGQPMDVFPRDARRARALAIEMGSADTSEGRAEETLRGLVTAHMQETRRIVDKLFYDTGRAAPPHATGATRDQARRQQPDA